MFDRVSLSTSHERLGLRVPFLGRGYVCESSFECQARWTYYVAKTGAIRASQSRYGVALILQFGVVQRPRVRHYTRRMSLKVKPELPRANKLPLGILMFQCLAKRCVLFVKLR